MKHSKILAVVLAGLLLVSLSGCALLARIDSAEERIDDRIDAAEDALESNLPLPTNPVLPSQSDAATLSPEDAQAIALEHAGFTSEQVSQLRAEYEIDDGIPQYDVEFREGRWEYSYEIHAETGAILSFEKDD
ncbi:MAG: PepSY domain-containing protein [Oscillospiraceae bacterium]|nr:PepSY domain-containing protein [Oscillospiraceae bacterium]